MSNELEILAQNRDAILLAEVAGLLHDMGKCTDEHIINQASDKPPSHSFAYKTEYSNLLDPPRTINLLGETIPLSQLVEKGMPRIIGDPSQPWLLRALGRCHAAAHIEKEEADKSGKQLKDNTRLGSAFGHEPSAVHRLTEKLKGLPFGKLSERDVFVDAVRLAFSEALGETRRPENEVTLWDWSGVVAAMYKAACAGALLGYKPEPDNLRWRLLSVRVDSIAFLGGVVRIADLKARQDVLSDAFERVRVLLERTYPLGTHVYRDADSALYIVPNLGNLLDLSDAQGADLRTLIRHEFAKGTVQDEKELSLSGEVVPWVEQDARDWWGQKPRSVTGEDEIPPIGEILHTRILTCPDPKAVMGWWTVSGRELCPVCRLRPMQEKAKTCEHCRDRRASRMEEWLKNPGTTIWMDEIADHNDRVALLVGKFGLDDWLSGDLVQTLLVKAVRDDPDACVPKNPSPARLRRVWETTQRFWEEAVEKILKEHSYAGDASLRQSRLIVVPDRKDGWQENMPYDGTINGGAISLLWRKAEGHFVTISNLQLAAGDAKSADELAQAWQGRTVTLSDPDNPRQTFSCKVAEAKPAAGNLSHYAPHLPLLTSPDRFLALAPAADSLDLVDAIRKAYVQEFGKVQNRLPILLGLVFFPRKMPLAAVMDTGRRLLETPLPEETWQVKQVNGGQVEFENGIVWDVPVKMGDGTTEDFWYPYFFVEGGEPTTCPRRFQVRDGKYRCRWLAHVSELTGIAVKVCPSRFAYLFLEHTGQRFGFDPQKEAFRLDVLPRLTQMWKAICRTQGMSDTKLRGIQALFDSRWQAWRLEESQNNAEREVFKRLVEATFKREKIACVTPEEVLNGTFRRCLDIHLRILKRKVGAKKS